MPKVRGREASRRFFERLPDQLRTRILPGAARAGARVIADDARLRLGARRVETKAGKVLIADSVKVRVTVRDGVIRARVMLKGPGAYVGRWLEYGTNPHFITIDDRYRGGITARRQNKLDRNADADKRDRPSASLFINGKAIGTTAYHRGSRAFPFLRPALDTRRDDAMTVAQAYIAARLTRRGIVLTAHPEGDL